MDYYYEIQLQNEDEIIENLSFDDISKYELKDITMLTKYYNIYTNEKKMCNSIILFTSDMPTIKAIEYIQNYIKCYKMYGTEAINTYDIILLLRFENYYLKSNYII